MNTLDYSNGCVPFCGCLRTAPVYLVHTSHFNLWSHKLQFWVEKGDRSGDRHSPYPGHLRGAAVPKEVRWNLEAKSQDEAVCWCESSWQFCCNLVNLASCAMVAAQRCVCAWGLFRTLNFKLWISESAQVSAILWPFKLKTSILLGKCCNRLLNSRVTL